YRMGTFSPMDFGTATRSAARRAADSLTHGAGDLCRTTGTSGLAHRHRDDRARAHRRAVVRSAPSFHSLVRPTRHRPALPRADVTVRVRLPQGAVFWLRQPMMTRCC